MNITLYVIGTDEDDAQTRFPYSIQEQAETDAMIEGLEVYSIVADLDLSSIEPV